MAATQQRASPPSTPPAPVAPTVCLFCGGTEARVLFVPPCSFQIVCLACQARGPLRHSRAEAHAGWESGLPVTGGGPSGGPHR